MLGTPELSGGANSTLALMFGHLLCFAHGMEKVKRSEIFLVKSVKKTRAASREGALQASYGKRRHRMYCFQTRPLNAFPKNIYLFAGRAVIMKRGRRKGSSRRQQTANSLRRRRQRSRTWATAQRALAEERKWQPKVHQARQDDRFSSRFLSLLLRAAIVPTRPTPPLLCSPLHPPPPLSPTRLDAIKDVIVSIVHNMLPILGEQPRHLGYRPVMWFFTMTCRFPVFRLGDWFT